MTWNINVLSSNCCVNTIQQLFNDQCVLNGDCIFLCICFDSKLYSPRRHCFVWILTIIQVTYMIYSIIEKFLRLSTAMMHFTIFLCICLHSKLYSPTEYHRCPIVTIIQIIFNIYSLIEKNLRWSTPVIILFFKLQFYPADVSVDAF